MGRTDVLLTSAVDNAKAAVTRAHRYDPDLHPEFALFCEYFGTAPLAMRPGKPKDKNLIENALGVFWRWARRRVNERRCYSLGELNEYLIELANIFNDRIQRKYGVSRRAKFEGGEREKLLPLPAGVYSYGEWKKATAHPDCHIQVIKNFYSVPYQLRGKELDVRISSAIIEIYSALDCVARHIRAPANQYGRYFTNHQHLPEAHRAMLEHTPQHCLEEARTIGTATELIVESYIKEARHPLMYLRRAQGLLRLAKRYSRDELEHACTIILSIGATAPRLNDIEGIIKRNLYAQVEQPQPLRRKDNPFLRGQKTWSLNINLKGEKIEHSRSYN